MQSRFSDPGLPGRGALSTIARVRIIAGKAGRTAIRVPSSVTRPTTDFVRQAVFSILAARVVGARVLDLFAGSGALGLEALSRGAASCVFVENHRQATSVITKNLEKSKLTGGRVVTGAVDAFLRRDTAQYDLVFADPPYWKHPGDADEVAALLDAATIPPPPGRRRVVHRRGFIRIPPAPNAGFRTRGTPRVWLQRGIALPGGCRKIYRMIITGVPILTSR